MLGKTGNWELGDQGYNHVLTVKIRASSICTHWFVTPYLINIVQCKSARYRGPERQVLFIELDVIVMEDSKEHKQCVSDCGRCQGYFKACRSVSVFHTNL